MRHQRCCSHPRGSTRPGRSGHSLHVCLRWHSNPHRLPVVVVVAVVMEVCVQRRQTWPWSAVRSTSTTKPSHVVLQQLPRCLVSPKLHGGHSRR